MYDEDKLEHINPDTLKLFQKYQVDRSICDLSENTIKAYNIDLKQWFICMYDNQFNLSVLDATYEDLEEYFYWHKQQGNNLRWEQVNLDERMCTDVLEKERKIVDLYFSEEVERLLRKLIEYRKDNKKCYPYSKWLATNN